VFNNSETPGDLTALQSAALIVKLVSFVLLITEVCILIFEIITSKEMKKLGEKSYEKSTESQRRQKWSNKMALLSMGAMFGFIVLLILGSILTQGR